MSKRTSARVLAVLTCCPPGPPLAEKRHSSSSIRTTQVGDTRRTAAPTSSIPSIEAETLSGLVGAQLPDQAVDDVDQRRPALQPTALAEVARPVVQDPAGVVELLLTVQPAGHRRQLLDEIDDRSPQGGQGALLVDDDVGVDAVAGGPPLVLPHDPRLRAGQRVAPVDERVH